MKFNLIDFRDLLICIKEHDIQSIAIKQNEFELIVNKEMTKKSQSKLLTNAKPGISQVSKKTFKKAKMIDDNFKQSKQVSNKESEISFTIVSPMVGTFYRSPAPSEPYFIEIHDAVKTNQTVCIVEAMKLMNEIEAEVSGEVVEILAQDGDIVDCGQPLMKIKPD
uniref:Biotin carboxyl carrier protein of acetyl-CoA carboxylase n=1 Tax=Helminthocladia australis TaxID=260093 RepID=A0A1G4NTH4_9FLOR|nr:Acetyl-CoA carboxylase, biotin carboxyl carrier protein [Helminthocladia australis]SCW21991.1 Acetyl-CoA carboxylase, biotin carboxyl carrier protein [Helminthocladia australis]